MSDNNNNPLDGVDYSHRGHTRNGAGEIQTAGILGGIGDALGGAYDTVAGVADHAAGSTDEAIGRQFDDEQGGGIIDGFLSFTPGLSQSQETTERQIEQGIIDAPDGWEESDSSSENQDSSSGEFNRSGTPTTDSDNNNGDNNNNNEGSNTIMGMKPMHLAAGASAVVALGVVSASSSSGSDRSSKSNRTNRTRERGGE